MAAVSYLWLALEGDLRAKIPLFLLVHGGLLAVMVAAWRLVRGADRGAFRLALCSALLFRLVMAVGEPSFSDDVYRYLWDGRLQLHGIHPYRYAPLDPELERLRDENWTRINHPELKTIYPPLSQAFFMVLAGLGAGVGGFKLAMGIVDFGVVLALGLLLRLLSLPRDRLLLYAWNPLAVMEASGSGHHEPTGVLLILLAAAWILGGRPNLSTLAVAGSIHLKLLPAFLVPGYLRRWRWRAVLLFLGAFALLAVPYALTGPALGAGLFDYAHRWERNSFLFAGLAKGIEVLEPTPWLKEILAGLQKRLGDGWIPWDWLYRHVWPGDLARAAAGSMAAVWVVGLSFRKGLGVARESFLALAGVLLLLPTLHPWYLLWVLPFAAAFLSRGWLLLAGLVPLSYLGGAGEVGWGVRLVEYLPPLALMAWDGYRGFRSRGFASMPG